MIPVSTSVFPLTSRYATVATTTWKTADGRTIVYLRRRFVPPPERFALLQLYSVKGGERLDNITYQLVGDPEQFWRICDANRAMRPDELTEQVGRQLRITLPEGIPGMPTDAAQMPVVNPMVKMIFSNSISGLPNA
jgi:hypothetical protein